MSKSSRRVSLHARKTELFKRASTLAKMERWHETAAIWQQIIQLDPQDAHARANFALTLTHIGQAVEAIDTYGEALRLGLPEDEVWAGLGIVFCLLKQYAVARENLEMAVARNPNNLTAWSNLVVAYGRLGLVELALAAAKHVLAAKPDDAVVLSSLGSIYKDAGMAEEAISLFRRAITISPTNNHYVSNLLWTMLHADSVTAQDIMADAQVFANRVAVNTPRSNLLSIKAQTSTATKLRIGWVSADLRTHAVGHFIIPVLEQLNRDHFESVIYANSNVYDNWSARAEKAAQAWHNIKGQGDASVANLIRSDNIHILIDLSGHTADSRLAVFAHKPAPIQVTWLGHPGTSGLTTMDYIIVPPDPLLLQGHWCVETPIALPDCYCARDPALVPPNAIRIHDSAAPITFGCLNNFTKVSPSTLHTWASILHQVEGARLMLVASGGNDQYLVADIHKRFAALGITAERLLIQGRMSLDEYFATYQHIDLALDPFPFNGGTTGVDSLCMRVPFITLAGEALHSRLGANLLRSVGLPELITSTKEEYIHTAVTLANDSNILNQLRHHLYNTVATSALMDIGRFTQSLEELLQRIK